jgi:hypothetical protein
MEFQHITPQTLIRVDQILCSYPPALKAEYIDQSALTNPNDAGVVIYSRRKYSIAVPVYGYRLGKTLYTRRTVL